MDVALSTLRPSAPLRPAVVDTQSAPEREAKADYAWAVVVGSILALAVLREGFRAAKHPAAAVATTAKGVSRSDAAFGVAMLGRLLARIGATSLGKP